MQNERRYVLLTPGPLTTTDTVKRVMLQDHCTWDRDYNQIVSGIRQRLAELAGGGDVSTVLMQGSGTFSVEATIGSVVPPQGKVLVVNNGAYGHRLGQICERLRIPHTNLNLVETEPVTPSHIGDILTADGEITHVAVVHCETTTGLLNPAEAIGEVVRQHGRRYLVDAMSSFGGIPMSMDSLHADFLISSANKCIQGVPGFGFIIARRSELIATRGWARSLSLDLYDQWQEMEKQGGKWRYTSPTHVVLAFEQALKELDQEGGVEARHQRYTENQRTLVAGMREIGFQTLVDDAYQSPIITSFLYPSDTNFAFDSFYYALKDKGFVIYPGKVSQAETFRIGTIGDLGPEDVRRLLTAIRAVKDDLAS